MIHFFLQNDQLIYAVHNASSLSTDDISKLVWLFGGAEYLDETSVQGDFKGPRASMITPWSTNAVEICQNMGIEGIQRIEQFFSLGDGQFDSMLLQHYKSLNQHIFDTDLHPEPVQWIDNIAAYNISESLSLSEDEVVFLEDLATRMGRKLTDSEVFGFSQVNSEHCRHKIFNGTFVIDSVEMPDSLFGLIKKTSRTHPNDIISAYKDNVAFIKGPEAVQFAPERGDIPSSYRESKFNSVLSLKAETHNFPTTVEPFNGAATGTGGEIRDRMAGGQGSVPLAGTAVYMTSYPRLEDTRVWEQKIQIRPWLYQTPLDILIKASNGASDFGNKFGQPLITGSLLTFEHDDNTSVQGFDKVIMLAGGIGYGKAEQALKQTPEAGDDVVILGGDNYRIGMGGAAVSSADTGAFKSKVELNAIQRSNPEMQKRVANTVRSLVESNNNPIVSIHDHGAGGHLNCLSELVEATGGLIEMDKLPVGDHSLSSKEIIGNESQERMGLVIAEKQLPMLVKIAERERSPLYTVGKVTSDNRFVFHSAAGNVKPIDLNLKDLFGSSPKLVIKDNSVQKQYDEIKYHSDAFELYLREVLQLESVACKDWLTNKVDRCVGGRVAKQQCCGPVQLPLNNCGVMAMDYTGKYGIATSIGHAPVSGLINPEAGSRNSIAEALTNIIWAPLKDGIKGISLSANWMWPCKNAGEDARLYKAVQACSDFAIGLEINIPTGKDSLSMTQKYPDQEVMAPGTVIISAAAHCTDIHKVIEPVVQLGEGAMYYINMSFDNYSLGGSAFGQILNKIGTVSPDVTDSAGFVTVFNAIQQLVRDGLIVAGHDIGSGGLITTLLELCFSSVDTGMNIQLNSLHCTDSIRLLFAENAGIVFQAKNEQEKVIETILDGQKIIYHKIGNVTANAVLSVENHGDKYNLDISQYRDIWYRTSYLLDTHQAGTDKAKERYDNYKNQPLRFHFPENFRGIKPELPQGKRIKAAIIREKGSNSEREMANAMYLAGFDVIDIHMTDLIQGRANLEDIQFIGAVGGFSNSDVLGSAKGWAGSFRYNEKANEALNKFFARKDTLSIGICNGCQLFMELELIYPDHNIKPKMHFNDSHKYECNFTSVTIQENNSVMLSSLAGSTLGVWVSHGEGKFVLPQEEEDYNIIAKYAYPGYPANPNGSDYNTAMMCSADGRHLVTMPHIERSVFPWNWAYFPGKEQYEVSPWVEAFVNARKWLEKV
ncbi:MAG TPA: phosphoribosylformylglycinamidine synthase [Saprospiraceae bacterium]|jgi:phosphoribosylformylglycinamidine synthase|nr:phosphoribosylformylglycinamidine synthase [Saprospiraceae bacterium]HRO09306.1 phosphoribosylformylglycinamidine synthase [Saprospiraceae bacterium]HRP42536.1 phosphoribosylformylglycinamidine synthase [Saprospiraceae bacterium]